MSKKKAIESQTVEPPPPRLAPTCPPGLSDAARAEWDRVVPELFALDRVTPLDAAVLAAYCNAVAGYFEALAMIGKYGNVIKSPNGLLMQSPYVTEFNKHLDTMLRCANELGLTPASRLKFPQPSRDPWDLPALNAFG